MYPSLYLEKLNNAKLPELRQMCKDLGLKSGGLKQDIISRIYNSFKGSYDNYHHLIPQWSHFDIGTALIVSVHNELLSYGDDDKYYFIRTKIGVRYNVDSKKYRNEFYLDLHFGKNVKKANECLQQIIAGVTSDDINIYIRERFSIHHGSIDIFPIENDRIRLSTYDYNIELKEYPIGYIEESIEQGYNRYLDVLPKE